MCFMKSAAPSAAQTVQQEEIVRHQADASTTKNSQNNQNAQGFKQNIKTSAFGLEDEIMTSKKTLLGE